MKTDFLSIKLLITLALKFTTIETKLCKYDTEGDYCMVDNFFKTSDVQILCDSTSKYFVLIIWPNSPMVFDDTLNVKNCSFIGLFLYNIHKISLEKRMINSYLSFVYIRSSDFLFSYDQIDFKQSFFTMNNIKTIRFEKEVRYFVNTPKIVFKDSNIKFLTFREMINSNLKSNYLNFVNSNNITNLNSTIENLDIFVFKVRLDNKLLDKDVFAKTKTMYISYQIENVEIGVFNSFRFLKDLSFIMFSLKHLFHQHDNHV